MPSEKQFAGYVTDASIGAIEIPMAKCLKAISTAHLSGNLSVDVKGRFLDESPIRTSWIDSVYWDTDQDLMVVETRNSVYYVREDLLKTQFNHELVGVLSGADIIEIMKRG